MIRVEDALNIVLKNIKILSAQVVTLSEARERVLAQDIISTFAIPGFANSAMDGYALRFSDTIGASEDNPKQLEVIDDVKAGYLSKKTLKRNQAIRIMTGAPIPKGADCVIMVENTEKVSKYQSVKVSGKRKKEYVKIFKEVKQVENIRQAGEDIKRGESVIKKGTLLNPAHMGILASLGISKVKVVRRPKVAVLATGDEVIDINDKLKPGKIRSSNTYALLGQILDCGATPKNLGIAKDRPAELERKIRQGLDCDLILTSGGVSVGDYDLVKDILAKIGTKIKFWKVAMRPGKPLAFGKIKDKLIFGLPGNPVSSMVSFEIFVRPVILKMLGQKEDKRKEAQAHLDEDLEKKKGLRYFLRAQTCWKDGMYLAKTTGPQGSGILKSMAIANSLIILMEEEEFIKKGTKVGVRFLN